MRIGRTVFGPRRALRIGFILQLVALVWEFTWHLVLNPDADNLGLTHILTTHAPFNAALLLTFGAATWFAVNLVVRKSTFPSLALIGIATEAGGWVWDLIAHASHAHGPGPQLTMVAGAALAIAALLLHDRRDTRSFDHPAAQPL